MGKTVIKPALFSKETMKRHMDELKRNAVKPVTCPADMDAANWRLHLQGRDERIAKAGTRYRIVYRGATYQAASWLVLYNALLDGSLSLYMLKPEYSTVHSAVSCEREYRRRNNGCA